MAQVSVAKLPSCDCHWASVIISQHWFRWWFGAFRQQVITCANVDSDPCRHMTSLWLIEGGRYWHSGAWESLFIVWKANTCDQEHCKRPIFTAKRQSDLPASFAWTQLQLGRSHWKNVVRKLVKLTINMDKIHINVKVINPGTKWMQSPFVSVSIFFIFYSCSKSDSWPVDWVQQVHSRSLWMSSLSALRSH